MIKEIKLYYNKNKKEANSIINSKIKRPVTKNKLKKQPTQNKHNQKQLNQKENININTKNISKVDNITEKKNSVTKKIFKKIKRKKS